MVIILSAPDAFPLSSEVGVSLLTTRDPLEIAGHGAPVTLKRFVLSFDRRVPSPGFDGEAAQNIVQAMIDGCD